MGSDLALTTTQNVEETTMNNESSYLIVEEPDLNDTNLDSTITTNQVIQTSSVGKNHPAET